MAKASPNLALCSKKAYKFEQDYYPKKPYKSNSRSLIAFLSSVLFYTSIFYIFNLSPSTLFYNSKFWFVISNTLILIIVADYSSSKHDQISYQDEYLMHRQPKTTTTSSFVEENFSQIGDQDAHQKIETPENKPTKEEKHNDDHVQVAVSSQRLEETFRNQEGKPGNEVDVRTKWIVQVQPKARKRKNSQAKIYNRSKSEEVRRVSNVDEFKTITRSKTMEKDEEENEYATMSNEELNRRSEEFIRRFNEQIRRQSESDRRLRAVYYDHV